MTIFEAVYVIFTRMIVYLTSLSACLVATESKLHLFHDDYVLLNSSYRSVMTGSYSNNFSIYNRETNDEIPLQADKSAFKAKRLGSAKNKMGRNGKKDDMGLVDFNKKILHASWNPRDNVIAVAATNNLFIFA
jgi:hypothetical protein